MKKWIIAAVSAVVLILIGLSAFLVVQLVGLAEGTAQETQSPDLPSVEAYAGEHWRDFQCSYDGKTLVLAQKTDMTYENACAYGGNIYTEELAPETYLSQVYSIRADVLANCKTESLEVELSYLSTEGEPIFTVSSTGDIFTCWEDAQ